MLRAVCIHGRGEQSPHTYIPKRKPVEEYLTLREQFRHLFETNRQDEAIRHIQERVEAYWKQVKDKYRVWR